MTKFNQLKTKSSLITYRNLIFILFSAIILNFYALNVSAESIFNLMGLVSYSDGNSTIAGDSASPNSFANARAYRSNIDTNFKNSNKPSDRRIYEATGGDPAYFLFDVGSSAWSPDITSNDTSIVVLETYAGQNGWVGPAYVAGVKSNINQNHLNANGLDFGDANITNPIQNAVMEQIPTPTLKSETTTSLTIGWKALWDNNTGAQGGTPHNSIVGYSVYRSDNQAAFEFLGSVAQNPGVEVTYEDTTPVLGHNYIYKIRVQFEWSAHNPAYYETVAESAQSEVLSVSIPIPDRLAFTTSEQTIIAGNNSSVITIQTRDEDGNDTPVQSDTTINLISNSTGANKTFYFAQNNLCTSTVITNIQILTGSSSAQICYYDDKSSDPIWTLTASKSFPTDDEWQNATQVITVNNANIAAFDLNLSTPQNNKTPFTGLNELIALDSFGNIVKNFDASLNLVTFSFNPVDGNISGLKGVSGNQLIDSSDFVNGVANLSDLLTFSGSSGFHTFTATSANNITVTSEPIFINPAQATKVQIVTPPNVIAGTQFNITSITALDEFNNIDTSFSGSKLVSYSGPGDSPFGTSPAYTTSVNFINGVSVTPLSTILVNAENTNINVTVENLEGDSNNVNVSAANAVSLDIIAPNTVVAGENFNITSITALDQYGNIDSNYSGLKTLAYSGPGNGPVSGVPTYTTAVDFVNGVSSTPLVTQLVNTENVKINITDAIISGESENINVTAGAVGGVEYISGNNQTAQINNFLASALVVKVTDIFGNPKNNYPVSFVITKGNGYLAIETPITNADGLASQNFRLGSVAATNSDQVQVEIIGANGSPIIFDATATPNAAANLLVIAPDNVTAGTPFSINLTVVDDQSNIITNYSGIKTIAYSGANNSPNSSTPTYTTSVEFINGTAVNIPTTLVSVESTILNLSITEDNLNGTSNAINVAAASTSRFVIEAPSTVQSGVAFNLISIKTTDTFGNDTIDYNGVKTLEYSGAAVDPVSGNSPVYTLAVDFTDGVATTILSTTLFKAEIVNLLVKEENVEGTSNPISVVYNQDFILYYVSGNNQTGVAGRELDEPLKVIVLDSVGNPALDKVVTFTVTNGDGTVSQPNTVDSITGEVSVIWTLGTAVGSQSITAAVDGISTTIDFVATAVSDSASIIVVNPVSISTYATYSTEEINICLQDQFGNQVVTNINRTINLESSSSTGQFSTASTGPWGSNSSNIIIGQSCVSVFYKDSSSGIFTFTASSNSITSGLMTINVLALTPTTLIVTPSSFTINSSSTQQLSAIVYDQFNQSMANVSLVWEMNNTAAGTITQNGQYYPANTAGTYSDGIKVSFGGLITYSTPTVTVSAAEPEPEQPSPTPVIPSQPVLVPITPTLPEPVPTEEVIIIVDQDYFGEEEGEIPIKVEVPAITILSPKQGSLILSNGNVSISGMSTPDQLILVRDSEGNTLASVTSDKNGYWKTYVGRNKFNSDQGTVTATVFKSNVSTLPLTFDFKPRSIVEYIMGLIFQ